MLKKTIFALMTIVMFGTAAMAAPADSTTEVVKTGTFEGRNDHVTTGNVSIVKTDAGYVAVLESNFSLDGAPAPTLGFGKNGFDEATEFTKLASKDGLQVYQIPANINIGDFDEFYVWCSQVGVALGVASLK